jgi:hypothetical protein
LLIAVITMDLLLVGVNARLNTWNREFYDALESKGVREFPQLMLMFAGLAFTFIMVSVYNRYLRQMLGFRWRQWLTTRYLGEWLTDGTFYRIERDRLADNPDQRIAVDLDVFTANTLLSRSICSQQSRRSPGSPSSFGTRRARCASRSESRPFRFRATCFGLPLPMRLPARSSQTRSVTRLYRSTTRCNASRQISASA